MVVALSFCAWSSRSGCAERGCVLHGGILTAMYGAGASATPVGVAAAVVTGGTGGRRAVVTAGSCRACSWHRGGVDYRCVEMVKAVNRRVQ